MSVAPPPQSDRWRWPNLALWTVFFGVGLFPEYVYNTLREHAGVLTQEAMVNSVNVLLFGLAGYFAFFTWQRCREAGMSVAASHGKATQLGILGLAAFLPIGLHQLPEYRETFTSEGLRVMYAFALGKFVIWLYLYQIVLRFYLFSGYQVFERLPALFPSARAKTEVPSQPEDKDRPASEHQ